MVIQSTELKYWQVGERKTWEPNTRLAVMRTQLRKGNNTKRRRVIKQLPGVKQTATAATFVRDLIGFYWNAYGLGGLSSGLGSLEFLAWMKAALLNLQECKY